MENKNEKHINLCDGNLNKDAVLLNDNTLVKQENNMSQNKDINQCKNYQIPLTPYQQYKQSKNKNGAKYFQFYDDIKVYTHNIYDW